METIEINNLQAQELVKQSEALLEAHRSYVVMSDEAYVRAGEDRKIVTAKMRELDALRKEMTRPLDASKSKIMAFFKTPVDLLTQAKAAISSAMLSYTQEQERKRREEEARLQELARKEEEKRRKALERKAAAAEKKGQEEKAEELREEAEEVRVPVPYLPKQTPKAAGIHYRTDWKFQIMDPSRVPREYCMPDEQAIRRTVNAEKDKARIPGVKIYAKLVVVGS